MEMCHNFDVLKGLTLKEVIVQKDPDVIDFVTACGRTFRMFHTQDCCEAVYIESIVGDQEDLIGHEITLAEESSNSQNTEYGHATWTFYKLATIKGYVDIRWCGESNGYYSEAVDFYEVDK